MALHEQIIYQDHYERKQQFNRFVKGLFESEDLVEIRAIKHGIAKRACSSRVVDRLWLPAIELVKRFDRLDALNRSGADIYFGVNPRTHRSGNKDAIHQCRSFWADVDNVDPSHLSDRLDHVPDPTIVVASGHGAHVYWKLDEAELVEFKNTRFRFESMLRRFCTNIGADSTHDVSRILRLPGFLNLKREPKPCRIVSMRAELSHSLSALKIWCDQEPICQSEFEISTISTVSSREMASNHDVGDVRRIRGLIAWLDRPVKDRSRRDFGVVCQLLRLGLAPGAVCQLVDGHSKFTSTRYTNLTVKNAMISVRRR